jgi:hypothetical protein
MKFSTTFAPALLAAVVTTGLAAPTAAVVGCEGAYPTPLPHWSPTNPPYLQES